MNKFFLVVFQVLLVASVAYPNELHDAVATKKYDQLRLFIQEIVNGTRDRSQLDNKDKDGRTPIELASELGDSDAIEILNAVGKKKIKRYHSRLFVGEADFSYTEAFLNKHTDPELPKHIQATAYEKHDVLKHTYPDYNERRKRLKKKGVQLWLEVDATSMASQFSDEKFDRIHFNFPHDRSSLQEDSMRRLVHDFFRECSKLQKDGGRVHFTLPEDKNHRFNPHVYHQFFGLYDASQKNGYQLAGKRKFNSRYPGYQHCQTGADNSISAADHGREYIFVKSSEKTAKKFRVGNKSYFNKSVNYFSGVSTDNDSSCCYSECSQSIVDLDEEMVGLELEEQHARKASRETIEAIHTARVDGVAQPVNPEWVEGDGNCAFHALATALNMPITREQFLAEVATALTNDDHPHHAQVLGVFQGALANYGAGHEEAHNHWAEQMAAVNAEGNPTLWTGAAELTLLAILNDVQIQVLGLGNNEFVPVPGNTFGPDGAPNQIWLAHVNAGGPLIAGAVVNANHYIALHRQQADITTEHPLPEIQALLNDLEQKELSPLQRKKLIDEVEQLLEQSLENKSIDENAVKEIRKRLKKLSVISEAAVCKNDNSKQPPPGGSGSCSGAGNSQVSGIATSVNTGTVTSPDSSQGKLVDAGKKSAFLQKQVFRKVVRVLTGVAKVASAF